MLLNVVKNRKNKMSQKKKNWPQKGSLSQKGHKLAAIGLSSFAGGDILKSCAQSKFEAKWLTIALLRTDRTFWDQNCPIPKGQVRDRIWKFAHCHILDIITQQKPAKFQVYWSTVSIVVRPRNFGAPKRVITPKAAQICPKYVSQVLPVE